MDSFECNSYYDNWNVLQVKAGRELFLRDFIIRYSDKPLNLKIFSRVILHKKDGQYFKFKDLLFPGYLFVQDEIIKIENLIKKKLNNEFVRSVSFNGVIGKIRNGEIEFLLKCSDEQGIIHLSYGYKTNNEIKIVDGPLKNFCGKILFINEKKRKIKIELFLLNRRLEVSLGFDLIENITAVQNNHHGNSS